MFAANGTPRWAVGSVRSTSNCYVEIVVEESPSHRPLQITNESKVGNGKFGQTTVIQQANSQRTNDKRQTTTDSRQQTNSSNASDAARQLFNCPQKQLQKT